MRKLIYIVISCLLFSCNNRDKGLSEDIYNAILKYQKENDFSKSKNFDSFSKNYVYEVRFYNYKDTTIAISTAPSGIIGRSLKNVYGIYSDDKLYPTIIRDENRLGKKVILEYKKNNLESFYYPNPPITDISIPIYIYTVKNGKLILEDKIPAYFGK